ncbi:MAG: hypothetical protein AB8G11_23625 [Saprospiraceae bacterium]
MKIKFYTFTVAFLMLNTIYANSCEYITIADLALIPQHVTNDNPNEISKVLVKTFALNGQSTVVIDFEGEIEVKEWSENTMRIHTNITLKNSTTHMLKYLMSQGRYQIKLENVDKGLLINTNAQSKKVIVSKDGATLNEVIKYTIFVPKHTEVINLSAINMAKTN